MQAVGLGFRAAWGAERDGRSGSRLLCADGERLAAIRGTQVGDWVEHEHWRMTGGWAVAEHPGRREYMMYLFDPKRRRTWRHGSAGTTSPWNRSGTMPVGPEESVGYVLALRRARSAGPARGRVGACRTAAPGGGGALRPGRPAAGRCFGARPPPSPSGAKCGKRCWNGYPLRRGRAVPRGGAEFAGGGWTTPSTSRRPGSPAGDSHEPV